MSAVTITQMADRVSALIEERLGVRGRGLEDKIRKAGRRLPKRVREAASYLAEAGQMAQIPSCWCGWMKATSRRPMMCV